jgi:hypothetical protein
MWMQGKGLGSSARKLVAAVSTIRSMDVLVPVRRGQTRLDLRVRTVTKPDPDVALLLAHLGLKLPSRSKIIENVVEKTNPLTTRQPSPCLKDPRRTAEPGLKTEPMPETGPGRNLFRGRLPLLR